MDIASLKCTPEAGATRNLIPRRLLPCPGRSEMFPVPKQRRIPKNFGKWRIAKRPPKQKSKEGSLSSLAPNSISQNSFASCCPKTINSKQKLTVPPICFSSKQNILKRFWAFQMWFRIVLPGNLINVIDWLRCWLDKVKASDLGKEKGNIVID